MKFSKRSRYGIRALIDLAQNSDGTCMQLSEIAARNSISIKYLEQIFAALRKSGILRSVKGPQGGYSLTKAPGNLKVADIIRALDGSYLLEPEESSGGKTGNAKFLLYNRKLLTQSTNRSISF